MTLNDTKKDIRCCVCLTEFDSKELIELHSDNCPICKTIIKPMKISEDGYFKLNWQDIRVMAIYAQRWAHEFKLNTKGNLDALLVLQNIMKKLSHYKPKGGGDLNPEYQKDTTGNGIPSPYF